MVFNENIPKIESIIGYKFKDKSLLQQAFTRSSFCNEANVRSRVKYQSNEVLEFFGDSVLSLSIVTMLIQSKSERYKYGIKTELGEGDFSVIRSKLSDKKNLSDNITRMGLWKMLLVGGGDAKLGIAEERSVKEDLFESIIGAVYIDSEFDLKAVMGVVGKMLDVAEYLGDGLPKAAPSYKNILQEWCAEKSRRLEPPVYKVVDEAGPDHNKSYLVACIVDGKIRGYGTARGRRQAEAEAARAALASLGIFE